MSTGKGPVGGIGLSTLSLVQEESEDEGQGREDEIKDLLAHAFSVETLEDDDNDSREEDVDEVDTAGARRRSGIDENAGGDHSREHDPFPRSLLHKTHCPAGGTDRNGNVDDWKGSGDGESVEELKTVAEFRERQVERAEERVEQLCKDKRALAHQLALLKTEAIGMKNTEEELRKTMSLKEEQNLFYKEKVAEMLKEVEMGRRNEEEAKDDNVRLRAQIEKLQQEAKLLSAIGLSTKESDLNDALRQVRQKHGTEIKFWREKVTELESTVQTLGLLVQRNQQPPVVEKVVVGTQTQTHDTFYLNHELQAEKVRHGAEKELWTKHLTSLETRLQDLIMRRQDMKSIHVQTEPQPTTVSTAVQSSSPRPSTTSRTSVSSEVVEVQTEENMETYKILGTLIESWVKEVNEADERVAKAEMEAEQLTKGLRTLKTKFKMLKKLVMVCRKEWGNRERVLVKRWNASERRLRMFLESLGKSFDSVEAHLNRS